MRAGVGRFSLWLSLLAALAFSAAASAVTIDWTFVGNPGNGCDAQSNGCFGSVSSAYNIGTYEVTNSQYAEFLNAVASISDPYGLYNETMGDPYPGFGGITRSGIPGSSSFSYSAIAGRGDMPVNYVSFYDALRFSNWLHNGQPTGAQDGSTTENGAYTITAQGIADNAITRNAAAAIFLPSEDEWYKAAYYDALSLSYFDYPAGSDTQPVCAGPTDTPNQANCYFAVGDLTDVGSYTGSASPYGTFDQGGNVFEWNDTVIVVGDTSARSVRGGGFLFSQDNAGDMAASNRIPTNPLADGPTHGFRVASIPEPGTGLLVITGLLGLAGRRKRRT